MQGNHPRGAVKLPKGVHRVVSRGRQYFYFQEGRNTASPGPRVKLPSDPQSPEFWQAIGRLKGEPVAPVTVTMNVVFDKYLQWLMARNDVTAETKRKYSKQLNIASRGIGHMHPDSVRPADIRHLLDQFGDVPGTANNLLGTVRALSSWAVERGHLAHSVTESVKPFRSRGGHKPWTPAQCAAAERSLTGMIRRAYFLARYTGQRGSDVIRIHPGMIDDGGFRIVQQKTGREVWVPIEDNLAAEMATWAKELGPYLKQPWGKTYGRKLLDKHFRDARDAIPELAGATFHGLRSFRVVELRRRGATITQIQDHVGMSLDMIERYCRFSDKKADGKAAVLALRKRATET